VYITPFELDRKSETNREGKPMEAVVFQAPGKVKVEWVDDPMPGSDEVLISVKAAGLCGTDLHIYQGEFPASFPLIPGHEFAGEVISVGEGVTHITPGDRVCVDPNIPCRRCTPCKRNRENLCQNLRAYGVHLPGGFAKLVSVKAENVYSIGDLTYEEGAMIEPLACVLHGIEILGIHPGDKVLIFGAGPIGLLLAQVCKVSGAGEVLSVDLFQARLDFAKEIGVEGTYLSGPGLPKELQQRYPDGLDAVIDATGVPQVVERLSGYVKDGGKILYFGVCPEDSEVKLDPFDIYRRELKIFGTFSLLVNFIPAIELVKKGMVDVKSIVSHKLALKEFHKAMDLIRNKTDSKKILLLPGD